MQIKNRQQMLILVAGAVFAVLAADRLILPVITSAWKSRAEQITRLRTQVNEGRQLLDRADSLRRRWDYMSHNTLTNDTSLAEQKVVKAFDTWSRNSNVSINSITPQLRRDADDYMTLQCRVDGAGNISTVSRFLYEIEKDPMALKVESVEITARDKDGQQLALGLTVSGLILNSQEEKP